jgi:hypothetical protein
MDTIFIKEAFGNCLLGGVHLKGGEWVESIEGFTFTLLLQDCFLRPKYVGSPLNIKEGRSEIHFDLR